MEKKKSNTSSLPSSNKKDRKRGKAPFEYDKKVPFFRNNNNDNFAKKLTTKNTKLLSISFNSGTLIKLDNLIMSKTTYIMATVVLAPTTDDLLPNAAWQQQPSSAAHSVVAD